MLLENTDYNEIASQQVNFLKDLMNGFEVYKSIKKLKGELNHDVGILYLKLLGNSGKNVNYIFLKTPTDKHNEEIYLQPKILFLF